MDVSHDTKHENLQVISCDNDNDNDKDVMSYSYDHLYVKEFFQMREFIFN